MLSLNPSAGLEYHAELESLVGEKFETDLKNKSVKNPKQIQIVEIWQQKKLLYWSGGQILLG